MDDAERIAGIGLSAILEAAPDAKVVFAPDLKMVAINARYEAMTGVLRKAVIGRKVTDAFPQDPGAEGPDTGEVLLASFERAARTGRDELPAHRHDLRLPDGSYQERHWIMVHTPLRDDGDVVGFVQTTRDVTYDVLAERLHLVRQRSAQAAADLSFIDYDPETDVFIRASDIDTMFGFAPGEAGPHAAAFFARMHPDDLPHIESEIARVLAEPEEAVGAFDYRIELPNGGRRWAIAKVEAVRVAGSATPHLVGSIMDVTPLRETEQLLREEAAARQALLDETNHRVKNSLQLVQSLLAIECKDASGTPAADQLNRAGGRIRAVASAHSELYGDGNVRMVDYGAYLPRLIQQVAAEKARTVTIDVPRTPVCIPADTAIPLALLVNEILTYLPDTATGQIAVRLAQVAQNAVEVIFEHDGTDRTDDAILSSKISGASIVPALVRQLNARLENVSGDSGNVLLRVTF